jgi:hypothetical protein
MQPQKVLRLQSALSKGMPMKRPTGVTILALLILLYGFLVTLLSLAGLILKVLSENGLLPPDLVIVGGRLSFIDLLEITAQIALGLFALVSGVGMLRLRPWAWLMAMLLLGCELAIQLGNYFQGRPAYLVLFITALLVFYLNQRLVREAFSIEPTSSEAPADLATEPTIRAGAVELPGTLEH